MRPRRLGQSGAPRQSSIQRRAFIGPPSPFAPQQRRQPIPHKKYEIVKNRVTSFSVSWLSLGITAATTVSGSMVAKKAVQVGLSKIGTKGQAVILGSIMKVYSNIPGIESVAKNAIIGLVAAKAIASYCDDLNKHGVKFTVYATYEVNGECKCDENKDHGDRQLLPQIIIDCSTY